jgi:hypothetical protein
MSEKFNCPKQKEDCPVENKDPEVHVTRTDAGEAPASLTSGTDVKCPPEEQGGCDKTYTNSYPRAEV